MLINQTVQGWLNAYDFETITVSTSTKRLSSVKTEGNVPDDFGKARAAYITSSTSAVRYRFDDDPTSTVGHVLPAGDLLTLTSYGEVNKVRFIRDDSEAVDAKLSVTFLR